MEISSDRWTLAQWLINTFWFPLKFEDGVPIEVIEKVRRGRDVGLPLSVKEWFTLVGRRRDFWDSCDSFIDIESQVAAFAAMEAEEAYPLDFEEGDEIFWFVSDTEAGFSWGVPLYEPQPDDPPVYVDPDAGRVEFAHDSFCAFMTERLIRSTFLLSQFTVSLGGDEDCEQRIGLEYPLLPAIPESKITLYGNSETLIQVVSSPTAISFQVAAKTKEAVERFCECIGSDKHQFQHRSFFWSHRMSDACVTVAPSHIVRPTEEMEGACQWPPCHSLQSPEHGMTDFNYVQGGYPGYMRFGAG